MLLPIFDLFSSQKDILRRNESFHEDGSPFHRMNRIKQLTHHSVTLFQATYKKTGLGLQKVTKKFEGFFRTDFENILD